MAANRRVWAERLRRWGPALVVATVLLVAAVVRTGEGQATIGPLGVGLDKYLHAVGYGLLAWALAVGLRRGPTAGTILLVVGLTVGYGVGTELVQSALPYRACSPLDVVADGVGAAVAVAVWRIRSGSGP